MHEAASEADAEQEACFSLQQVSSLEARYGGGNTSIGAKKRDDARPAKKSSFPEELDDAEFDRIQNRLEQKRAKR